MHSVTVLFTSGEKETLRAKNGSVLRDVLLKGGINPNGRVGKKLNCGGNGICATCGIKLLTDTNPPRHWHDKLAHAYGYLRLSCQIVVESDLQILLDDAKIFWGKKSREYPT
jgi:ferredoxin